MFPTVVKEKWEFLLLYEIDFESTFMYKYLTPKGINLIQYFRENVTLFKINAEAKIFVNYCEVIQLIDVDDE